jgi:hypothetical protein
MQDVLVAEQEDHRETWESVNAFNVQIQAFMTVRNNNIFIAFLTFSDIYVYFTFKITGCGPAYPECRWYSCPYLTTTATEE